VDTRDDDGETPLKTASRNGYSGCRAITHRPWRGCELPDNDGWTPLHATSDLDTVQQLLDHGADVNIRDNKGQTAFHRTLDDDQLEIVRYFLTHGTEVDILSGERKTASGRSVGRWSCRDFPVSNRTRCERARQRRRRLDPFVLGVTLWTSRHRAAAT
jgi:ankyrin repeat protein